MAGVVFIAGRVDDSGERVLTHDDGEPVDGVLVWLESRPDRPVFHEELDETVGVTWIPEPEPYGVLLLEV
ncbi:MAG: hypothetical protein M3Y51_11525 [Actinomycetota bacterium]|nr:hypothetical protein [Actinomycetota bacterium]